MNHLVFTGAITLDGVTTLANLDISSNVVFSSNNPSVLSVNGRLATGVSVGSATVSFGNSLAPTVIAVTSNQAVLVQLHSYVYSAISMNPLVITGNELAVTSLTVQPTLSLTAELQTAYLVTYALDDDGVWTDVSQSPYLNLTSVHPADLTVGKSGSNWQVSVPVGASSVSSSSPVIAGILSDSCGASLFLNGYGYASTNLSVPIAIVVTASATSIARPGTPAATVLAITTSVQLTVTVTFRSSLGLLSYKDFTVDSRTAYASNFTNAVGVISPTAQLSLTTSAGAGAAGSVTIVVSFPSYSAAAGLTGTIILNVVDVNSAVPLQGLLLHSMTTSVPVTASTPLSPLSCTGF